MALSFVNAKINIGLNVTSRRPDGYHNIESVFYPVGVWNGTPENPRPFSDVLEILPGQMCSGLDFKTYGDRIEGAPERNLVRMAAELYLSKRPDLTRDLRIRLEKHLPSQAGLGGGSADASFTLRMLADLEADFTGLRPSEKELTEMAKTLGADCPFFIYNKPAFVSGIGDKIKLLPQFLEGWWCLVAKPSLAIPTAEAFKGIVPAAPEWPLKEITKTPVSEWKGRVKNDFEVSLFPKYPELKALKEALYSLGAVYASLSGSGSALYGLFKEKSSAETAYRQLSVGSTNTHYYLLKM